MDVTVNTTDLRYGTKFDALSLSSCFLKLIGPGEPRQASGFFWRYGDSIFLVTNWHVVTGKDCFTKEFLSSGWCPESLEVRYNSRSIPSVDELMTFGYTARAFENKKWFVSLQRDYHDPPWIQHRRCLEQGIDVVLLKFDDPSADIQRIQCLNDYKGFKSLFHFVGCDLLVVGFPLKDLANALPMIFPVWKRGSLASELVIPWNGRPMFLIDCRTSRGMSGSPVIRRAFGPAALADLTLLPEAVVTSEFMGIYSCRLHDDQNNASIGVVWHRHVIDEILADPLPGARM